MKKQTKANPAKDDASQLQSDTSSLSERQRLIEEARKWERFFHAENQAAEELLIVKSDSESLAKSIVNSIGIIGRVSDADLVKFWRNEIIDGELCFVQDYEWQSEIGEELSRRAPSPIGDTHPYSRIGAWKDVFLRNECINSPVSNMSKRHQDFLNAYGMKSLVVIPLFLENHFWGLVSIEDARRERVFSEDEINIFRSISLMMANAINRNAQARRLEETYARTTLLLDSMPYCASLWNRELKPFACNEDAIRFFKLNSKQDFLDGFHDRSPEFQPDGQRSREKSLFELQKAFEEERRSFEWLHQALDGTLIPTEVNLVRVPYENDYVIAAYFRDLREHKKMMEEIANRDELLNTALSETQKANNAKSLFLANMSHEMRTPLNAIIGLSSLSLENIELDAETYSNLEKIYRAGSTLLSTVNDILDISKIEAGKLNLVLVKYELPSIINDAVTQNILRIGEKPITFVLDVEKDMLMRLYGDELRIKQIINNLLSNAIKYTQAGTIELGIQTVSEGESVWLKIRVQDTGRGIHAEDIETLFDDYLQLDLETNHMVEGTGLGLPITKRLTEMMEGTISVESEFGKGSVFTVMLRQQPVDDCIIGEQTAESLKSFRYSDSKRESSRRRRRIQLPYARVLVVDDNYTNLVVAQKLMKPYKMKIDCLTSGEQAVEAIRDGRVVYNAIFMDQMMPDMDGIEAVRLIREMGTDYARDIPIIAFTANAIAGSEQMFLSKGFQAFLSKPVDPDQLDEIINLWVQDDKSESVLSESLSETGGDDSVVGISPSHNKPIFKNFITTMRSAGLDIEKGIKRFGGREADYLSVLRSYASSTRSLIESVREPNENNLSDYTINVHGIKGASRGVFANRIGNAAEELEKAAIAGDMVFISDHNEKFLLATRDLVEEIEEMLTLIDGESPRPKREKPGGELLSKLADACDAYDIRGVEELIVELESYEYEQESDLIAWIREQASKGYLEMIRERLSALESGE